MAAWRRCSFERRLVEARETGGEDGKKLRWEPSPPPQIKDKIKNTERAGTFIFMHGHFDIKRVAFFFLEIRYNDRLLIEGKAVDRAGTLRTKNGFFANNIILNLSFSSPTPPHI